MLEVDYSTGRLAQPPLSLDDEDGRRSPPACRREREAIEYAVVRVFGIAAQDLERSTRGRAHVALARQVAMYIAHVGCGLNLTEVGRLFARDRTTVAHACGVVEDRRDDPTFDRTLELLERAVVALAADRVALSS